MTLPQANLGFGAIHHLSSLHARHRAGISFSENQDEWREYAAKQYNQAVEFCRGIEGRDDSYMGVNGVRPFAKRCFETVTTLTANFVDLDFYTLDLEFDYVLSQVITRCDKLGLPAPSSVIDSGRGCYALWEFSKPIGCGVKVPNADKRKFAWQDTQAMLISLFVDLGADPACKDVSRVLRIVGTNNSKVNRPVTAYTVGERLKSPIQFSKALKELINPKPLGVPQKVAYGSKAQPKGKARTITSGNMTTVLNTRSLGFARAEDLRSLAMLRGGKLTDNRAMAIFFYALSMSSAATTQESLCRSVSDFMESHIALSGKYDPSNPEKLLKTLLEKHNKQKAAAIDGDYTQYQYKARNETIIRALNITPDEQRQLKTIIGKDEKYRRNNERRMKEARTNGVIDRASYEANAKTKAARAKQLKADGLSNAQIALELDVHIKSVSRLIRGNPKR